MGKNEKREREREREREYEVFLSSTQGGKTRSFAFSKEPYTMQRANATVTSVSSRGAASLRGVSSRVTSVRRTQHVVRASSQPQQQEEQKKQSDLVTKGAKTLAAIAIAATVSVADVHEAYAAKDISGLTKCAKSKPYAKREKQAVKALQKRLKKYEEGSAGANAINSSLTLALPCSMATRVRFSSQRLVLFTSLVLSDTPAGSISCPSRTTRSHKQGKSLSTFQRHSSFSVRPLSGLLRPTPSLETELSLQEKMTSLSLLDKRKNIRRKEMKNKRERKGGSFACFQVFRELLY